nr:MAG TPA: hypothetical protein [Caudoviricetes sp.]
MANSFNYDCIDVSAHRPLQSLRKATYRVPSKSNLMLLP